MFQVYDIKSIGESSTENIKILSKHIVHFLYLLSQFLSRQPFKAGYFVQKWEGGPYKPLRNSNEGSARSQYETFNHRSSTKLPIIHVSSAPRRVVIWCSETLESKVFQPGQTKLSCLPRQPRARGC